jgi:hypothetical protein
MIDTARSTTNRFFIFVLSVAVLLVLAAMPSAFAAQGGNGGGKPGGEVPSTASVSVSPNPASANGSRVDITGCGYEVKPAEIRIVHSAGYTEAYMDGVWAEGGCLNPTYFLTREAGTYTVSVYQTAGNRRHPTQVLKATTTLTVE